MILEINNKQAGVGEYVCREAKRLLRFSLSRFSGVVSRVKVRLYDVNGPKGGIDKRCRITVKLRTAGQVIVLGEGADYIEALNNCLQRLVRTTRREIDKRRSEPIRKKRREMSLLVEKNESRSITFDSALKKF